MSYSYRRQMKKIFSVLCLIVVFSVAIISVTTQIVPNLWGVVTGRGYAIPEESSVFAFKVTQMNEGSGEWWLYGEDDVNYYSMMEESNGKPYTFISKANAEGCVGFDKLNYVTWKCE